MIKEAGGQTRLLLSITMDKKQIFIIFTAAITLLSSCSNRVYDAGNGDLPDKIQ